MAATRHCPDWVGYVVASLFFFAAIVLAIVFVVGFVRYQANRPPYMRYYISIDSASGLDLPPLDPQFNLTIRLASSRPSRSVCMNPGTYLLVSHRCVPLATSAAATQQLCVGGAENSSVSMHVVIKVKGTGVRLPGYMMNSLVADLRSGVEAFEVRFKMSGNNLQDLASCGFRRLGDVPAECGPWLICPDIPPAFIPAPTNIQSAQHHPLTACVMDILDLNINSR